MKISSLSPYLVVTAGDGSFRSSIADGLGHAIRIVAREFGEADDGWIREHILDQEEWEAAFDGTESVGSRTRYRGEQCYFELLRITAKELDPEGLHDWPKGEL